MNRQLIEEVNKFEYLGSMGACKCDVVCMRVMYGQGALGVEVSLVQLSLARGSSEGTHTSEMMTIPYISLINPIAKNEI